MEFVIVGDRKVTYIISLLFVVVVVVYVVNADPYIPFCFLTQEIDSYNHKKKHQIANDILMTVDTVRPKPKPKLMTNRTAKAMPNIVNKPK